MNVGALIISRYGAIEQTEITQVWICPLHILTFDFFLEAMIVRCPIFLNSNIIIH